MFASIILPMRDNIRYSKDINTHIHRHIEIREQVFFVALLDNTVLNIQGGGGVNVQVRSTAAPDETNT